MKQQPMRNEVEESRKWRLEDIFPNDEEWERGFARITEMTPKLTVFRGRLSDPHALLEALNFSVEAEQLIEKVYAYARMHRDEDNTNSKFQAMSAKAMTAMTRFEEEASFMSPELLAIPQDMLDTFYDQEKGLLPYKRHINEIVRKRAHVLSEKEEKLIALTAEMSEGAKTAFTMLNNADMKFGNVEVDGEEVELTHGRYGVLLRHNDRRVRKDAFTTLYEQYDRQKNTLSALLTASLKSDLFYTRARGYESVLAASLFEDNVPIPVYQGLVEAVHDRIASLHRYVSMRKKAFDIEKVHFYDLYAPMVKGADKQMDYAAAVNTVKAALAPLGDDYLKSLDTAFQTRWIDVEENKGKTSGAYSWGVYGVHPYVLLNWQDDLENTFTLAHELGHAMHSKYSFEAQPYVDAHYKIFVAEVASTVNEALLMEYLIQKAPGETEKAILLNHYLENFRTTFFRQTMFAEFEMLIHGLEQKGEALTQETMCGRYAQMNQFYHGPDIEMDPQIALECLRIPHFYNSFYVYKYATGFASAIAITKAILSGEAGAVDRYLTFLKGGGSDYPLELLKKAGVDLFTPAPVMNCIDVFDKTLDQLEKLL